MFIDTQIQPIAFFEGVTAEGPWNIPSANYTT